MTATLTPPRTRALTAAWAALAVVAFGLVWLPYYGDQALYAVIGRDVLAGRVPYTSIWDIKQPGVFLWYGAVDAMFGPSPVVTRTLDVAVAVLTAVLVGQLLRGRVAEPVRRWVPVAGAAVLLLPVRALDLGQVEQLAVLPATGALLLVLRPGRARALAAGLCIGVVAVLKLWVAVVPLAAVLVLVLAGRRRTAAPLAVAVLAGAAVPMLAVLGWLAGAGALGAALDTWLAGPGQVLAQPGARPVERLVSGAGRYALVTAAVLVPAAFRVRVALRERDPLDLALLAWIGAALAVVAMQLWWSYHWVLLTPALLALAARQLAADDLGRKATIRQRIGSMVAFLPRSTAGRTAVVLGIAALPLLVVGVASPERPMLLGNGFTAASRAAIDAELGSGPAARAELAAAGVVPGESLYVLGDPTYQLLAGVPYPARLNGWTPELFTDAQWDELATDLRRTRPRMVFLENIYADLTAVRGNTLLQLLNDQYDQRRISDAGVWYRITDPSGGT